VQDREPFIAGINDLGQIVGVYNDAIGAHAFLYKGLCITGGNKVNEPMLSAIIRRLARK